MKKLKALAAKAKELATKLVALVKGNPKTAGAIALGVAISLGALDAARDRAQAILDAKIAAITAVTSGLAPLEGTYVLTFYQIGVQTAAKDVQIRPDGTICYTLLTDGSRRCAKDFGPTTLVKQP